MGSQTKAGFSSKATRRLGLGLVRALGVGWMIGLAMAGGQYAASAAGARTPEEARAAFRLADPRLTIELVASEPQVSSPVAMSWDLRGRLFVAEMNDYPVGTGGGRIRLLEDRDGDARLETSTVFAEGVAFPNSVLAWNNGVLITAAPDLLFLKDNDGDGQADERRVLFTGFAKGNQQLRANGLYWGLDGWIYGANGRSDGEITRPGETNAISLRGHDFRFRPETGEFETVAGRSQFGLARDDWGGRFLSWNTVFARHDALPEAFLKSNPRIAAGAGLVSLLAPGDDSVFPTSRAPLTFNRESVSHFNALGGLFLYRGGALPPDYQGNLFAGETLLNLVHRRSVHPKGGSYEGRRTEQNKEFLSSDDPWFHPVNFSMGPDGALYIADFYRLWVEHPNFVPEGQRGEQQWQEGSQHGRIWRVRRSGAPASRAPALPDSADPAEWVKGLGHTNGWVRDASQQWLVNRKDYSVHPLLKEEARKSTRAETRVLALHTLQILNGLDETNLLVALSDPHPRVREAAIQLALPRLEGSEFLARRVLALVGDRDERVRMWVALAAARATENPRLEALGRLGRDAGTDGLIGLAVRAASSSRPWPVLEQLLWMESSALEPTALRLDFLEGLGRDVGAVGPELDRQSLVRTLGNIPKARLGSRQVALAAGLIHGWQGSEVEFDSATFRSFTEGPESAALREELVAIARRELSAGGIRGLGASVRVMDLLGPATGDSLLLELFRAGLPAAVQQAAAGAWGGRPRGAAWQKVFDRWADHGLPARRMLASQVAGAQEALSPAAEALSKGRLGPGDLGATALAALRRRSDPQVVEWLSKVPGLDRPESRTTVLEQYKPALSLAGDPRQGKSHFSKLCASCHQLGGEGIPVGPDLKATAGRTPAILLSDILDPNAQVSADYVAYEVALNGGSELTGLVIGEGVDGITLRRAGVPDELIPRKDLRSVKASSRSLMPEGLEQGLSHQQMADLLAFIRDVK